jgi:hypothetical protein
MENPVQLQLAPWGPATNYKGAVKAASVLPNRPDCSAAITGARRVRHVPVRNLVQEPHQRAPRHDSSTHPGSLERPADRSQELGVSGILTT